MNDTLVGLSIDFVTKSLRALCMLGKLVSIHICFKLFSVVKARGFPIHHFGIVFERFFKQGLLGLLLLVNVGHNVENQEQQSVDALDDGKDVARQVPITICKVVIHVTSSQWTDNCTDGVIETVQSGSFIIQDRIYGLIFSLYDTFSLINCFNCLWKHGYKDKTLSDGIHES